MLSSILDIQSGAVGMGEALICIAVAIGAGFVCSLAYLFKNASATKSMAVSLVLLPAIVQTVIMLVNGNLGAGIAVLGAFSLIRFRSVPGSARDICSIFSAMAAGLACGMGYVVFAGVIAVIVAAVQILLIAVPFGEVKRQYKELRILVPESLDYTDAFYGILSKYTVSSELVKVKTANLGSMYDLRYRVVLKNADNTRELIDAIRCRNGNLTVALGNWRRDGDEL
ncbi:MAG: DUF4956 domain-containing protein [Clostridia bacterium]|nr:DUF4956 domain-containing protein [Clostridia bacterium]